MMAITTSNSMSVNAAGGFLRIARGLWRLCCLCTNSLVEAVQALAAASAAARSGERTRLACWFWRLAKTCFPGKVRDRGGVIASTRGVCAPQSASRPLPHLFRERTLRAIGIILHAKIFVDLEQPLLVRDRAQKFFPAGIISKKTRRSGFESPVR